MKVVILAYITGFLLLFGLLWFDSLLQIPFAVVVLFGLLFSIWLPVKKFKSGKDNKKRWVFLLPFILVCLSIAIVFLPMRDYKVSFDHVLLASKRMEFINELQTRHPPVTGAVKLPHWWLSKDGEAYVYQSDDQMMVGFWVVRGMLSPSWIVVYTTKDTPPSEKDMLCDNVEVIRKLSPHWYYLHLD